MNIALWIVQVLLAVAFMGAGVMKTFTPINELVANGMPWAADYPALMTRAAGISEILGSIGLVVPRLTGIRPKLTAYAAFGLATVMVLAFGLHVTRGEYGNVMPNLILGGLAGFVAWGRCKDD